jgi:uncharacterized repeat protein (TIGR04076 family)
VPYDVTVKVISQKGHCIADQKVVDEWVVGSHTLAGICVAAFNSLLPTIRVLRFNGSYGDAKKHDIACPDATNPMVYEVKHIR